MLKKLFQNLLFIVGKNSNDVKIGHFVRRDENSLFEGHNRVGNKSYVEGIKLGSYSYIGTDCILNQVEVGRFSSIGDRVIVITGDHPTTQNVSTSPAFYSTKGVVGIHFSIDESFREYRYVNDNCYVKIGNDVWIGSDVRIMHGVTIGDGAIVGTGSIITHDIEPYSINVGVPARKIKMRFNQLIVSSLIKMQWWNWDEQLIKERADLFKQPSVFVNCFGGNDEKK